MCDDCLEMVCASGQQDSRGPVSGEAVSVMEEMTSSWMFVFKRRRRGEILLQMMKEFWSLNMFYQAEKKREQRGRLLHSSRKHLILKELLQRVDRHTLIIRHHKCVWGVICSVSGLCGTYIPFPFHSHGAETSHAIRPSSRSSRGIAPPGPHPSSSSSSSELVASGRAAVAPYVRLELITHLFKNPFTSPLPLLVSDSSFFFFVSLRTLKHSTPFLTSIIKHLWFGSCCSLYLWFGDFPG